MKIHKKYKTWIVFLCFLLVLPGTGFAQEVKLTNIAITRYHDDLLFKMNLDGAFREDMNMAIMSGVPATFSFYIKLNRVKDLWFNSSIADVYLTHTIKYDALKKVYTVSRPWKNSEPVVTESFKEAQELMTQIDGLKIVQLNRLEKNGHYQIETKAEVSKLTLPFYLHYVFLFVSLWDFETDWYIIDFVY
ncbi:MAG: DUF4390 domain-containing protein [Desulfobacteraceae bacterium]|nr:MAG: DUF4390 domain-containing protein [Desulfobacteraceae bacterium]